MKQAKTTKPSDSIEFQLSGAVAAPILAGWKRRGLATLLPMQRRALDFMRGGAETGGMKSVLLVAPTSSGKTLVAEMAIAHHLAAGRKAVYLVPTKALAEEKLAAFQEWLGPSRLRVVCATRDRSETDGAVALGRFDLLVAVYEKMNHYLLTRPQILAETGVLVVDELQMLGDAERGRVLDLLLTKVRLSPYPVQIVALSAVIRESDASRLSGALGCELMVDRVRPRELREGVTDLSTGIFRYREAAFGEEGEEQPASPAELERLVAEVSEIAASQDGPPDLSTAGLLAVAALLARRGEQTLVFAPSRRASRDWASWLAAMKPALPPARLALPRLSDQEPGRSREEMRQCLERGVAFHNADLSEGLRAMIESAFNEGEIRIVVSTPTLGMGVNLAARNVLQCTRRIESGAGGPVSVSLGRARFSNQGGRAARLGLAESFGRSMVVASSEAEADRLRAEFVLSEPERLPAPLRHAALEEIALDLLAGGVARTAGNLESALKETCSAHLEENDGRTYPTPSPDEILRALENCGTAQLLRKEGEFWRMTGLGETASAMGLSLPTVAIMIRQLEALRESRGDLNAPASEDEPRTSSLFQVFLALAQTREGRSAASCIGLARRGFQIPSGAFQPAINPPGGASRDDLALLRAASLLTDWVGGMETEELEQKHRVHYGAAARIASEFQWLLAGMAAIARTLAAELQLPESLILQLRILSERTAPGVAAEALPIFRLKVPGLSRTPIQRLLREGIATPEAAAEAGRGFIAPIAGEDLAARIESAVRKAAARTRLQPRRSPTGADSVIVQSPPVKSIASEDVASASQFVKSPGYLLEIDLKSPGVIRALGREVALTPMGFELLAALAERPGQVVSRQALYARLWPEGGPEDQQLDGHRRALIRRLKPALGEGAENTAQVIRGMGFRLAHPPDRIQLQR